MVRCKAVFFLGIFSSRSSQNAWASTDEKNYQLCRRECQNYFDTELDKTFCQPALNLLPRPGVYTACMNGILYGFKASCLPTCLWTKEAQKDGQASVPDSFHACKREAGKAHPNNEFSWCRSSYDVTFAKMKTLMIMKSEEPTQNSKLNDKEGRKLKVTSNSFEKEYEDSMKTKIRYHISDRSIDTNKSTDIESEEKSLDNSEDFDFGLDKERSEDDEIVDNNSYEMDTTEENDDDEEGFYIYNPPSVINEDD